MSAVEIPRKIWTREDLEHIDPVLAESLELVNGELIDRMGKRPPHMYWTEEIRDWLIGQFGGAYVRSEQSIDVRPQDNPTNEPEPDVAVTRVSRRQSRGANPKPEELRLVVEVSDRTFRYDTTVKAELYARAEIREYWVVDVRVEDSPRLLIYREPRDGRYREELSFGHDERVAVLGDRQLCLRDLM